ncbi:DctQ9 protein [Candidatus Vecturithrix granuli]|uniref:DctQ9 protein n=1 Tax=Vecturithrix granuli TaxID=1499967 RepID=A0A0S6W6M1_VECG1|nr:DctQ9 protein [Candidatus Vecturithrix granuli]
MIKQIDRYMNQLMRFLIGACLAVMTILTLLAVFNRYVLNAPISWAEEVVRYLMIWMAMMGLGIAFRENRLVAIVMFQDLLPARPKKFVNQLIWALILFFSVMAIILGIQLVHLARNDETAALGISMIYPYLSVPVGFAFLILQMVFMALEARELQQAKPK